MSNLKMPKMNELIVLVAIISVVALAAIWASKNIDAIEDLTDKRGWF